MHSVHWNCLNVPNAFINFMESKNENSVPEDECLSQNQLAENTFSHLRKIWYSHICITFICKCSGMFIFTPELIIFMLKLDKKEYGVLRTTNFNPAWIHYSVDPVYIQWGFLLHLYILLCTNSGSILHEVRRGLGKHYREHRHLVWTTALFNVSRMLVNLTLLKSTVKHYAKYDITSAQTRFMIFNFIYRDQGWAGHRVQFKTCHTHQQRLVLWVESFTPDLTGKPRWCFLLILICCALHICWIFSIV